MNKEKRRVVIAGNWKMNKNARETRMVLEQMRNIPVPEKVDVVLCVPAINIPVAAKETAGSKISIGAQNCHWEKGGAFTGEISADMLKYYGVSYSVIGHSERRQYFGESDESVNKRAAACLENGICPIICVGENLRQRESGTTKDIIRQQVQGAVKGFTQRQMAGCIIAYEPVWAIGTGKTATARQAQEVCSYIRQLISEIFGLRTAEGLTIQYGGSMNAENARQLLAMEDIDGGLIGGASLKAEDFEKIVASAQ